MNEKIDSMLFERTAIFKNQRKKDPKKVEQKSTKT